LKPERSGGNQQCGHHDGKKRTVERVHVFTLPGDWIVQDFAAFRAEATM
jgi:hypothetical protein